MPATRLELDGTNKAIFRISVNGDVDSKMMHTPGSTPSSSPVFLTQFSVPGVSSQQHQLCISFAPVRKEKGEKRSWLTRLNGLREDSDKVLHHVVVARHSNEDLVSSFHMGALRTLRPDGGLTQYLRLSSGNFVVKVYAQKMSFGQAWVRAGFEKPLEGSPIASLELPKLLEKNKGYVNAKEQYQVNIPKRKFDKLGLNAYEKNYCMVPGTGRYWVVVPMEDLVLSSTLVNDMEFDMYVERRSKEKVSSLYSGDGVYRNSTSDAPSEWKKKKKNDYR